MPMRYATEADVLAQLRLTDESPEYERLVRLENGLCDVFDHKTGTSFGTAPVAETRTVVDTTNLPSTTFGYPWELLRSAESVYGRTRLLLSTPIREITSIAVGGTWNGVSWDDTETLGVADYRLNNFTNQGAYAIDRRNAGSWDGVIHITGVWGDQVTTTVPADVREALTFLTVNEWHTRNASPAGQIGPDGMLVTPRNPWAFEVVKAAIDRHTVVRVLV